MRGTYLPFPHGVCAARELKTVEGEEFWFHNGPQARQTGSERMRKAAGAVAAAFAMGTGVMTWMGVAFATQTEAAALGVMGLALYASSALLSGKTAEEATRGMANQT